ncbi:MAG: SDR family oxidoreductase [Planctomycetia bacterium]|nr:SDR family oxidoreductase [Planctomycetia bacterium]
MEPLKGRVAIVTGASQGIGLAIGVALSEAGASVAFNYRKQPGEAAAALARIERSGGRAILLQGDVAEQATVEGLVRETVATFGRLDIAVTNAAYSDRELFHEADMAGFRRTVDVTMWGAFYLVRAAAQQMIAQQRRGQGQGGSIVVVSSPHSYVPIPRSMAYNMSKAALDQMARTAAIELVEHKIRVNIVTPGWIDTPGERKFASDETIQGAAEKLPWKRLGKPEEIARGVVFLCDRRSDYITGSSLLIDGGITLPWWAHRGSGVPE